MIETELHNLYLVQWSVHEACISYSGCNHHVIWQLVFGSSVFSEHDQSISFIKHGILVQDIQLKTKNQITHRVGITLVWRGKERAVCWLYDSSVSDGKKTLDLVLLPWPINNAHSLVAGDHRCPALGLI